MKIDATKKQRLDRYFDDYMAERRKPLLAYLALSIVLTIVAFGIMYPRNEVYSYGAIVVMLPIMYKTMKTANEARKYARKLAKRRDRGIATD